MSSVFANGLEWRSFDRLSIVTPLGIRFWDAALDRPIPHGLRVEARPLSGSRATRALATPSGVYVFHGLPGLGALELGHVDRMPDPESRGFRITVVDDQRRFLPVRFDVQLPFPVEVVDGVEQPYDGLLRLMPGSNEQRVFLFSTASRPTPAGLAAVRGQVSELPAEPPDAPLVPAAGALIEIGVDGAQFFGLADASGNFAAIFPYPSFDSPSNGEPPAETRITDQTWEVTTRVRYTPPEAGSQPEQVRDLLAILAQPPAAVRDPTTGDFGAERHDQLRFGRDLVIRSDDIPALVIRAGA